MSLESVNPEQDLVQSLLQLPWKKSTKLVRIPYELEIIHWNSTIQAGNAHLPSLDVAGQGDHGVDDTFESHVDDVEIALFHETGVSSPWMFLLKLWS